MQQPLTAIVSPPSWWQKGRVVLRTCWRGEYGFPEAEATERRACSDDDEAAPPGSSCPHLRR